VQNDWRGDSLKHRIEQHGYTGNMIKVGVSHKYMANARHLVEAQLGNPGTAIDQNIVVNQQRRRA
jgi:hypothetical protein